VLHWPPFPFFLLFFHLFFFTHLLAFLPTVPRLEELLSKPSFDVAMAYEAGTSRESRRTAIAAALTQEISVVAPSRLLALLQQGVKWQQHTGAFPSGASIDLFRGRAQRKAQEEEKLPTKLSVTIKFGKTGQCNAATFSPDGQFVQPNHFLKPDSVNTHAAQVFGDREQGRVHRGVEPRDRQAAHGPDVPSG
jgi:hypothetical protein